MSRTFIYYLHVVYCRSMTEDNKATPRARKGIKTVDIHPQIYKTLKPRAEQSRYEIKALVNRMIEKIMDDEETAARKYPNLEIVGFEDNRLSIADQKPNSNRRYLVDVYIRDGEMKCDSCTHEPTCCEHVKFSRQSILSQILYEKNKYEYGHSKKNRSLKNMMLPVISG